MDFAPQGICGPWSFPEKEKSPVLIGSGLAEEGLPKRSTDHGWGCPRKPEIRAWEGVQLARPTVRARKLFEFDIPLIRAHEVRWVSLRFIIGKIDQD